MSNYKPKSVPNGTDIYAIVRYNSGIHRVQKLVSGENGKFSTRFDGRPVLHGNWTLSCYFSREDALEESRARNVDSLTAAIKYSVRFQQIADNIYNFIHGVKR